MHRSVGVTLVGRLVPNVIAALRRRLLRRIIRYNGGHCSDGPTIEWTEWVAWQWWAGGCVEALDMAMHLRERRWI